MTHQQRVKRSGKASKQNAYDTFVSKDGRIKATVSASEARIIYPRGKPLRLFRLDDKPAYGDDRVRADLKPTEGGLSLVLPGITLKEDI